VINLADPTTLIAVTIALLLGGTLKGAIGMGSPVIAVPVMASFFDVRLAVVIMVIPNLLTNLWQLYNFRNDQLPGGLKWVFATAGCIGALLGTMMLANFPAEVLIIIVATAVFLHRPSAFCAYIDTGAAIGDTTGRSFRHSCRCSTRGCGHFCADLGELSQCDAP
jgi:hypothetical protein